MEGLESYGVDATFVLVMAWIVCSVGVSLWFLLRER